MADRKTLVFGTQVKKGNGLQADASEYLALKIVASDGLALSGSGLTVDYDNATIGIISTKLAVKNGSIGTTQLSSGVDTSLGKADTALQPTGNGSGLTGITATQVGLGNVDNVQQLPMSYLDTDNTLAANSNSKVPSQQAIKHYVDTMAAGELSTSNMVFNEIPPTGAIDGSNAAFTLAYTPVAGKVSVYLDGVLQLVGSGNDYTISGATITFTQAPALGMILLVTYLK